MHKKVAAATVDLIKKLLIKTTFSVFPLISSGLCIRGLSFPTHNSEPREQFICTTLFFRLEEGESRRLNRQRSFLFKHVLDR